MEERILALESKLASLEELEGITRSGNKPGAGIDRIVLTDLLSLRDKLITAREEAKNTEERLIEMDALKEKVLKQEYRIKILVRALEDAEKNQRQQE